MNLQRNVVSDKCHLGEIYVELNRGKLLSEKQDQDVRLHERNYRVRSYEVDFQGQLQPVAILNYLQDMASEHAARLGFSVNELLRKDLTWVLQRSRTKIFRYPEIGESIRVQTWPSGRERLFALRDFEARDQDDRLLLQATSSWTLLNLKNMRPARLDVALPEYPSLDRQALAIGFKSLPEMIEADIEIPFRVRLADLDINQHVNNAIYAGWALEAMPEEVSKEYRPAELEISYRGAAYFGENILSRSKLLESGETPVFLHQLVNQDNGVELTRLKTRWQKRG